jgi:hypothetical protein
VTSDQLTQYQNALQPLTALTGTATLTPRNQVVDSKVSGTEHLDASLGQVVSQLSDQLGSVSAPFPKEPVGVGARWQTTSAIHLSGIDAKQVAEFTLRSVDGDQVTMDVKLTQTAPRQRADLPGVAAGTKVTLTKWRTTGSGQVTASLALPALPLASTMHSSGAQTFLVTMGSQRGVLDQTISIDLKVSQ